MKNIYKLLLSATFCYGTVCAQQNFTDQQQQEPSRFIKTKQAFKISSGTIAGRFDPGFSLVTANGVAESEIGGGTSGSKVGLYVAGVYCDSTTKSSFTTDSYNTTHKFGMNFDPKSIIWDNFNPLLSSVDSYYLDTVWIGGFYQKKTAFIDTLLVEVVFGDTSNTAVYSRYSFAPPYAYYGTLAGPKFSTIPSQQGNVSFLSAPASNKITIKHVLTNADSATFNTKGYLPIEINGTLGQLIPANNIVSCVATFVPGEPNVPVGSISWNGGSGISPQTTNGMVARLYSQNSPTLAAAGQDYFDDFLKGKNHSIMTFKRERYTMTGAFPGLRPRVASAFMIDFSIHGTSTVGLNELDKKGFMLGQNTPNPYNDESKVNYMLAKDAKLAVFTVTDIMGRVVYTENVNTTSGTHYIKLGSYTPGVYYYSLNVDGNVSTNKMIVE